MTSEDLLATLMWYYTHQPLLFAGAASVSALGLGIAGGALCRQIGPLTERRGSHGSARFASAREMRRQGLRAREGVVLGRHDGHLVVDNSARHILLTGPTESGKGLSTILPTLAHMWRESVIVLDPKGGENYRLTRRQRAGLGPVYVFRPDDSPLTRLNVLATVRVGTPKELGDMQVISQSWTAEHQGDRLTHTSDTAHHFQQLACWLLDAAGLHVLYTGRRKSPAGLWQFLTREQPSLEATLAVMETTSHTPHGVHPLIHERVGLIRNITNEKELSGLWTTAMRPLQLYSDPYVAASTEVSDIPFEALQYGAKPAALYLVAASTFAVERLQAVYRVVLDVAVQRLMEHRPHRRRWRLLNVCDEVAWFGYLKSIDKGMPVQREYGHKNVLVAQGREMLHKIYGADSGIWSNAHIRVVHPTGNEQTARRLSKDVLGRETIRATSRSSRRGLHGHTSINTHDMGRDLLHTDEVLALPLDQELIEVNGMRPVLAQKVHYWHDREFRQARRLSVGKEGRSCVCC